MSIKKLLAYTVVVSMTTMAWSGVVVSNASASVCRSVWSIGIAGLNDNTSAIFVGNVSQPVGYNSLDPVSGLREIDRLFWKHHNACPGDHITLIGHSEGAALVHVWVTQHQRVVNVNAVLLADPKRLVPGQGGPGLASLGGFLGYPLNGVDNNFGPFPVLTVCHRSDWVCNLNAPWGASHVSGSHAWYDFHSGNYSVTGRGAVLN